MSLQTSQLEAFRAVAMHLSFSKGAQAIHITQSAISQRIKQLEEILGQALFVRHPSGITLTEAGELLLRHCQTLRSLEEDLLREIASQVRGELAGAIRIAAYSSVLRSVLVPALAPLLRGNPNLHCELMYRGQNELAGMLQAGAVEFIVTDHAIAKSKIHSVLLGYESYVVIENAQGTSNPHVYLDNSPDDQATENFFRAQNKPLPKYNRLFLADCYGIIDGVERGLGRAVMPQHLLLGNDRVRIVAGYKPYNLEVYLHHFIQPHYSRVHEAVVRTLAAEAPGHLSQG